MPLLLFMVRQDNLHMQLSINIIEFCEPNVYF